MFLAIWYLAPGIWYVVQDPPRYTDAHLDCAGFREEVRTTVRLQGRRGVLDEEGARVGLVLLRTRRDGELVRFEAWYDSLMLWRDTPAGRVRPDTDGLVGGRWRGWLSATGAAQLDTRPFMPPSVREVADLTDTFADFFPPLPPVALAVGFAWKDSSGLVIERREDSAAIGGTVRRYVWRDETFTPGDTGAGVKLAERLAERGALAWQDSLGPVAWSRELTIETQLRPRLRETARSRVAQRITVRRLADVGQCR